MIKVAVLDDYQDVFKQIVNLDNYNDKFYFKVFNEPFADENQAKKLDSIWSRMKERIRSNK